mgnify:CR=1 FL=1
MEEKVKRKISYEKYLIAILVTSLFFISGIITGNFVAEQKVEDTESTVKAIWALLNLAELKEKFSENETINYCNLSWEYVWKEKVEIGSILASLEKRLGKDHEVVKEQKIIYNEVQAKTLRIVRIINRECGYDWSIILFFYTNEKNDEKGDYKLSELQGYALDTLYNADKEKTKIFAFDINAVGNLSSELIASYNVTYVPTLVINNEVYRRFVSGNEVARILKE